jgi:hypothetical protein
MGQQEWDEKGNPVSQAPQAWDEKGNPVSHVDAAVAPATETNPTTGITTPAGSTGDDSSSILGGMARRLGQTVSGAYHAVVDPATTPAEKTADFVLPSAGKVAVRAAKGFADTEATAGKQMVDQTKKGQFARAAVTGASMFDPFATGTVTDINRMEDEGKNREAIGAGLVDGLSLLLGQRLTEGPTARQQLARLTTAVGDTGTALKDSLPEIGNTIKAGSAPPKTLGEFESVVKETGRRLDTEFNNAIAPVARKPVMPIEIEQRIRQLITPDMAKTAEGRAKIAEINAAALEYQQPWTVNELNAARMTKNNELAAFYNKGGLSQMAATKSNLQVAIDKAVRDGAAEIVYNEMGAAHPGQDFSQLKKSQGALMNLQDGLQDRINTLTNKQLEIEGKTLSERTKVRVVGSLHGIRGYASEAATQVAPLEAANNAVNRAYGPTARRATAANTIRSLPLVHATTNSAPPPPPQ